MALPNNRSETKRDIDWLSSTASKTCSLGTLSCLVLSCRWLRWAGNPHHTRIYMGLCDCIGYSFAALHWASPDFDDAAGEVFGCSVCSQSTCSILQSRQIAGLTPLHLLNDLGVLLDHGF